MNKIELNNVSVSYIVGDFSTVGLKDVVIQKIKRNYKVKEFLAVDNVNFAIDEGDLLGIVGSNGAGKSTLLKVISGIMRPTNGTMSVNGNIASLLELGSGFDGDLTVKENTFLRGAMLGYTRDFMNQTYRDIIEFAELTEFENRLFSHLSSGMKSRLAFSIACLVKPDILILDEVLSVGDGAFRKKSENKMMEIIKGGSTTILVSHSLAQIRRMATKVLWLDKGKQIAFGETKEICDRYEAFLNQK
ncbi:MAG: ABC transporter ATP-binding protein [Ruminococcus sp.]|nr:ABC transporter ATP-binding protein [Ruminococcus sp.]